MPRQAPTERLAVDRTWAVTMSPPQVAMTRESRVSVDLAVTFGGKPHPFQVALTSTRTRPRPRDWRDTTDGLVLESLPPGAFRVWVRATDGPDDVIFEAGLVMVR